MRALTLSAGELEAVFVPDAGMVGCSLRHRGAELLGQRGGLGAYVAERKTMGIPLLYPWANRLGAWGCALAGRPGWGRAASPPPAGRSSPTGGRPRCAGPPAPCRCTGC